MHAVLDVLPNPLLVFDTGRRLIFANAEAVRYLTERNLPLDGEPGALCAAVRVFDASSRDPLPPERLPLARALRGETVSNTEYVVRPARRGASIWIECGARPVRGSAGTIRGAVLTFSDITQRKKRELSEESAAQLHDFIYHGNLAGILHTTVDGRILDCNDAIVRMFGYASKEELKAVRAPQLYYDPADRERLMRLVRLSHHVREFEMSFRRRDNVRRWALISTRLFDPPPGEVGGNLISTVIDITERKLSEEAVRHSQQRFAAFMRYLPGIAFIKDLSGKYLYYNDAAWAQFRKQPEDIVGKTDEDVWAAEDAARYRANDAAVIEGGRPLEFVEPMVQDDGIHSWLIYKFPIMEDGAVALVGAIGIDITERRNLEDQLTQARKMEALGRLAGGVAHDFNNLLTVISGYAQLALEGLGSASTSRMSTYLQEILNSSRRASGLTGQLLAFSRRQAVQPKSARSLRAAAKY